MKNIGVVNIGINNIGSITNAIETLGYDVKVIIDEKDFDECDSIVLPGVGSFHYGMSILEDKNFIFHLKKFIKFQKPLLGICLGMHLLFEKGFEGGERLGLGFIEGTVDKFKIEKNLKLPHIGWNEVNKCLNHPVWTNIKDHKDFYFVHSYKVSCSKSYIIGKTNYGENFPSIISKNSIIGMQFHPEKSQNNGLKILQNFLSWDGKC